MTLQAVAQVVARVEQALPVTNVHADELTTSETTPAEHFKRVPVVLPVAESVMSAVLPEYIEL